jgi:hypothetical protein
MVGGDGRAGVEYESNCSRNEYFSRFFCLTVFRLNSAFV